MALTNSLVTERHSFATLNRPFDARNGIVNCWLRRGLNGSMVRSAQVCDDGSEISSKVTAAEKTELWDGWKGGESLKAIGRAFGKPSLSIYFLVGPHSASVPSVPARLWRCSIDAGRPAS
jgi:hypothetical protein